MKFWRRKKNKPSTDTASLPDYDKPLPPGAVIVGGQRHQIQALTINRLERVGPIIQKALAAPDDNHKVFSSMLDVCKVALPTVKKKVWRDTGVERIEKIFNRVLDEWNLGRAMPADKGA